jgi:flagellar protein FliO/FliZ
MKSLHFYFQLIMALSLLCCAPIASFGAEISDSPAANGYPFTTINNPKDIKSAPVSSDTSILKTLGGLGLVLALIFVLAKVGKKLHANISAPDRALKIVSMLSLGTKEKVALIQVGKKQLLIGVTPQSINTLLELAEPIDIDSTPPEGEKSLLSARTASEFSRKLNEFLLAGQRHK